jgi:hypothetical protein
MNETILRCSLAIKKHGTDAIAGLMGLDNARAKALLASRGRRPRDRAAGAFTLTPAARMALDGEYSKIYADQRASAAFIAAYERFGGQQGAQTLITDWQTIEVGGQRVRTTIRTRRTTKRSSIAWAATSAEAVLKALAAGLAPFNLRAEAPRGAGEGRGWRDRMGVGRQDQSPIARCGSSA